MRSKQFTIYFTDPQRPAPPMRPWGVEYENLRLASDAILGQYGYKMAVEILGRSFSIAMEDAQLFAEKGIPFSLGFSHANGFARFRATRPDIHGISAGPPRRS